MRAPVLPVYMLDEAGGLGGASAWWLHHSLTALAGELEALGAPLILRRGAPGEALADIIGQTGATGLYWNRRYTPRGVAVDTDIKTRFGGEGVTVRSFKASLLAEPWEVATKSGGPFKVLTPFWRTVQAEIVPAAPLPAPKALNAGPRIGSDGLDEWGLLPSGPDWAVGLREAWQPGERGATERLQAFAEHGVGGYGDRRDFPAERATSRLSPHLRWGEVSPRQVWHAVSAAAARGGAEQDADGYLRQLAWREFSYHLLYHAPDLPEAPWRPAFEAFPWRRDEGGFRAWTWGLTGYPIVDAGMRELWHTGWMHNRVRMIAASFLVKDLLIDWRAGARWFWDTLVDADLANNSASWQWVAGSGADAAPYFRIFNPVTQGEKFDPDGAYVRRWVPEVRGLPSAYVHKPWTAPPHILEDAGVILDRTYPAPIVDHAHARQRALQAYATIKTPTA